jgi:cyclic beta-1,2-glucan synthetase
LSKWGRIQLGPYTGGAKLLFNEALKGVIGWGVAAWLFAVNRSLLLAIFQRETAPLRRIVSREGMAELTDGTVHVLRWGLWMAPIIFTFLRQMSVPTWYNQDGAIHTGFCIVNDLTMAPQQFHAWSLRVFTWVLGYDLFRVLIWLDHMGLRVATLVNLSFLGMDRLDEKAARFVGSWATARCIPEGIKRFTTWAPLLIPFYIPTGAEWDWAWTHSEAIQQSSPGVLQELLGMPGAQLAWLAVAAIAGVSLVSFGLRRAATRPTEHTLSGARYAVTAKPSGELGSRLTSPGYDVTRRAYEGIDPAGRTLFLAEAPAAWPVVGNYSEELFAKSRIEGDSRAIRITNQSHEIRATVAIRFPDDVGEVAAELWEITLENLCDRPRVLDVVPYLEWVLATPAADRGHTQYNRLFPEMSYEPELNAVLALHRTTKKLGILAADRPPQGFLTSRLDFIGRAGSIWSPGCLETRLGERSFIEPHRAEACPTFDPIGSLRMEVPLVARGSGSLRLLIGCAQDKDQAAAWVRRYLRPSIDAASHGTPERRPRIGHGRIPPGTPQPYCEFTDGGRRLLIHTPFTPRPFDHTMSNALGHVLAVTNRGLHSSASVNAQQNRITTDWADTATSELPSEAFYLYDLENGQWFSPTYLPLRDKQATYSVEFGVDGTGTFRMERPEIATELTTFVPPQEPTGVYLLTVTNRGGCERRLRLAPYFEIALADNPENAGPLKVDCDKSSGALFFENRRNTFRTGPAFAAMSCRVERVATRRGDFFGRGRSVAHPMFVADGHPSAQPTDDRQPVAGLLTTLEIPAGGSTTVAVVLGQADDRRQAEAVITKFRDVATATASLAETRAWWNGLMDTLDVQTSDAVFDGYLHWLKYQALAERIWARKGFYQASGAFGFRDQLQDAVNLIWVDPVLARRQILLHAAQQFLEGDVVHWFFRLQDGRTGFAARSHASDNLLWLGWAAAEYVRMTGDQSILDERVAYLTAETPLPPLPQGKEGMGFFPLRSAVEEPLLDHVLRAVDLVLAHRMGAHGLPLIGTGDWNDGLDEIGSQGRGESVWLGLFLYAILDPLLVHVERKKGQRRKRYYQGKMAALREAVEATWRSDRYLRAIHDDGTEIGVKGSGIWEIDALMAAWAVMAGINLKRARIVFDTAIHALERDKVILLGWPALREDSKPYLGRSCRYPEGVRENGMYCHGVQWLVMAARMLSERLREDGHPEAAKLYRDMTIRLWRKISPLTHATPEEIELYGGQPNKQAADMLTAFDPGRMIWNGYTGAAAWMLREACEGVIGARLVDNHVILPSDLKEPRGDLRVCDISRRLEKSPLRKAESGTSEPTCGAEPCESSRSY